MSWVSSGICSYSDPTITIDIRHEGGLLGSVFRAILNDIQCVDLEIAYTHAACQVHGLLEDFRKVGKFDNISSIA